jgi:hypothetical protein
MFTAFCVRSGCGWEAARLFADGLAALAAVDRHIRDDHGRRPADPVRTGEPDMLAVPFIGDGMADVARSYVLDTGWFCTVHASEDACRSAFCVA